MSRTILQMIVLISIKMVLECTVVNDSSDDPEMHQMVFIY